MSGQAERETRKIRVFCVVSFPPVLTTAFVRQAAAKRLERHRSKRTFDEAIPNLLRRFLFREPGPINE